MQEPERVRVFEKLILAARAEYELAESRWVDKRPPAFGLLFDYASGQPPMTDRANHIFTHAEGCYCILFSEYVRVAGSGVSRINGLFHPAVAEYEGFMPGEGVHFRADYDLWESCLLCWHCQLRI